MGSLMARPTGPASGEGREQERLAARAERFDALEMVRAHREDQITRRRRSLRVSCRERCELRSRCRSMPTSSAPSDADAPSQALVPALATSTSSEPALDRDLPRDRFGERTAAGVAGADE